MPSPQRNAPSASVQDSPSPSTSTSSFQSGPPSPDAEPDPEDSVTCSWGTCGMVFTHLPSFINHLHDTHIGAHKSSYTCEWSSCNRRGLPQTSRFALVSHLRSHTGERPFQCTLPECDKAFARQDALQKHLKIQHNIMGPSLRGKKKGGGAADTPPPTNGQGAFRINEDVGEDDESQMHVDDSPVPSPIRTMNADIPDDESDTLPDHLLRQVDADGLIHGRTQAMAMYLIVKAKHHAALDQHAMLVEELSVVRAELLREKEEKERALNLVLRSVFGQEQASKVIDRIPEQTLTNGHKKPEPEDPSLDDPEMIARVDDALDGMFGPMRPPAAPPVSNGHERQ